MNRVISFFPPVGALDENAIPTNPQIAQQTRHVSLLSVLSTLSDANTEESIAQESKKLFVMNAKATGVDAAPAWARQMNATILSIQS